MNNIHIKKIFEDYLNEKDTQYAFLLNGDWGSGKTYFWKQELEHIASQKKLKVLYLSLNGISRIETIETQILLSLIPLLDLQSKKYKFLKNIIEGTANFFTKSKLSDLAKGISVLDFDFKDYLICFDDLERCQVPVKEVLGFINTFVEHKKVKTLILADENNINKDSDYDKIKEKVIRRVINYKPTLSTSISNLIMKYQENSSFHSFLVKHKELFITIFKEFECYNLRNIVFYFDTLKNLYEHLSIGIEEKIIKEILFFSAIITIEFKKGDLKSSDFEDFKNLDNLHLLVGRNSIEISKENINHSLPEKEVLYDHYFYNTYIDNKGYDYHFYSSIYSYILSGYLNDKQLKQEIQDRKPEEISEEVAAYRKLLNYHFRNFDVEHFNILFNTVWEACRTGKYAIYDYSQIMYFLDYFSKNELIDIDEINLKNGIIEGLEIAKQRKEINEYLFTNLRIFASGNSNVDEIKGIIKQIHEEIKTDLFQNDIKEFIDAIKSNDPKKLTESFMKNQILVKIIQQVNVDLLFSVIININNEQLSTFTILLDERYNSINIGEFLFEEKENLEKLKTKIETHITKNKIDKMKKFLFKELLEKITSICQKLEDTKL